MLYVGVLQIRPEWVHSIALFLQDVSYQLHFLTCHFTVNAEGSSQLCSYHQDHPSILTHKKICRMKSHFWSLKGLYFLECEVWIRTVGFLREAFPSTKESFLCATVGRRAESDLSVTRHTNVLSLPASTAGHTALLCSVCGDFISSGTDSMREENRSFNTYFPLSSMGSSHLF